MKKSISFFLTCLLLFNYTIVSAEPATEEGKDAQTEGLQIESSSAILIDAATGQILYEKNANERRAPASVTKVMTMLIIMEELDKENISINDQVTVSQFAADMGGSQLFLEPSETVSVDDLLKGIAIESANDAAATMAEYIAVKESNLLRIPDTMAEYIAGDYQSFIGMMNEKAKELGMKDTQFMNSNGLPAEGHYSSANDIALMSKELVKYPKIHEYLTIWMTDVNVGKNDDKVRTLANTNKLLRRDNRVDGLKTGYTDDAGYCLSATAKEGSMRLISVVLDAPSSNDRFDEALQLLNYGFSQYKNETVVEENTVLDTIPINRGVKEEINVVTKDGYSQLMLKSEKKEFKQEVKLNENISAPIAKGDKVGELKILENGKEVTKIDLIAEEDVEKINFFNLFNKFITQFINLSN